MQPGSGDEDYCDWTGNLRYRNQCGETAFASAFAFSPLLSLIKCPTTHGNTPSPKQVYQSRLEEFTDDSSSCNLHSKCPSHRSRCSYAGWPCLSALQRFSWFCLGPEYFLALLHLTQPHDDHKLDKVSNDWSMFLV